MKLGLLHERGGKTAALFTGTPVSNSLLEMYVVQHYLHPQRLEELGLHAADAWAATFVEFQTNVEVTPDGAGFRMKRRPAKFENVPELLTLFGEIADLRPPESFAVQRPQARHHTVVIRSSPELRAYVAELAERADRVREVDAREDNMLKICSDGRKAALDLELVGITPATPGKVGTVISNVARIYHAHRNLTLPDDEGAPVGGFQIVFCDLGTPSATAGSQVYGKIRAGLIGTGVPAERIRFIHDASTDIQKAALFTDCRAGKVAVLLGSTDKLGVGTNIQTRCVAVHHVDAPWRPADVEQREGRALRPGNLNPAVDIFRYVSEKSFDSFLWQVLERKARFIGQVLGGRPAGRDVDDIGDATLSYAEVKALATGNPLLMQLAEANAQVTRLRHLATAHTRNARRLSDSVTGWRQQINGKTRLADTCDRIAAAIRDNPDPVWRNQLGNPIPQEDVAARLAGLASDAMASAAAYETLTWRGLRITFSAERSWRQAVPVATISAGSASLPVQLNDAWIAKGQHWRIEKEIRSRAEGLGDAAEQLRTEIEDLRQRAVDAARRIGEPFPQAAELEAARVRRDAIEQDIRDAAAPQGDGTAEPSGQDDLVAGAVNDVLAMSGMTGAQEITFAPAMLSPGTATLIVDGCEPGWPLVPAEAADGPVRGPASGEAPEAAVPAIPGEPAQASLELSGPTRPPRAADGVIQAETGPGKPAEVPLSDTHPVQLARLDAAAEPLFALSELIPEDPDASQIPRAPQPRRLRRKTAQPAALDNPAQPALFDLPAAPLLAASRRATTPDRSRTHAPRK